MPEDLTLGPAEDTARAGDLAAQVAMYRVMVENVSDVIVRGDSGFRRTYVSAASREMLGYEPAELVGLNGFALVHPDDLGRVQAITEKLGPDHSLLTSEYRMRRKDGTYIWVELRYRHMPEDGGVLAVMRDITARKLAEDRLAEAMDKLADANLALQAQVHRDGLTGLANRRCFDARLAEEFGRAVRQSLPLSLVLLDVDAFKMFNDGYGHLDGDDCLCRIGATAEGVLHRPGDLAARYGGEEIAVLLPATEAEGAMQIAEQIRMSVAALGIAHSGSAHGIVTVSAGVGSARPGLDDDTPSDLIRAADRALYAAKLAGRNRVCAAPVSVARLA